jgi:hypothetical protein
LAGTGNVGDDSYGKNSAAVGCKKTTVVDGMDA